MSYDVWIKEKNWETDSINHTSNCSDMWHKSLGMSLKELYGMKAENAIPLLTNAITEMINDPLSYEKMNPKNGWGSHKTAKHYLESILKMCQKYPDGNIEMSY